MFAAHLSARKTFVLAPQRLLVDDKVPYVGTNVELTLESPDATVKFIERKL